MNSAARVVFAELVLLDPMESMPRSGAGSSFDVDEDLLARILSTSQAPGGGEAVDLPAEIEIRPRHRRRHLVLGVAGALVLIVLITGLLARPPSHPLPFPTSHPPAARPWSLAADLTGPQFQVATGNPQAVVGVTCSDGSTCMLSTGYGLDYGGGGGMSVSHDGGHTWQASPMPQGVAVTSLASCPSDTWCAAGGGLLDAATGDPAAGKPSRDPELMVTTDGGSTWTAHPVPLPVNVQQLPAYGNLPAETTYWPGGVDSVSCSEPDVCNVLGQAQINNPNGSGLADELLFLRTTDGGAHWSSSVLPPIPSVSSYQLVEYPGSSEAMSCPSASTCVVVASPAITQITATWRTTDGGQTWAVTPIPGTIAIAPGTDCPSAQVCWIGPAQGAPGGSLRFLKSTDGASSWSSTSVPVVPTTSQVPDGMAATISCASTSTCYVSEGSAGLEQSTDGGSTWQSVPLPSSVASVLQVSCNAVGGCAAIANSRHPPLPTSINQFSGGSLILTNKSDMGATQ